MGVDKAADHGQHRPDDGLDGVDDRRNDCLDLRPCLIHPAHRLGLVALDEPAQRRQDALHELRRCLDGRLHPAEMLHDRRSQQGDGDDHQPDG